ncbi:MAG: siderophore-interacting protein [Myxococcota bacterium]
MSVKGRLLGALGAFVLTEARVTAAVSLSPRLRRITLQGDGLKGVAWHPGDKVQVLLPSQDTRTYTPCAWDGARGVTSLLVFSHGQGPGSLWGAGLKPGDLVRFVGPQRSITVPRGPVVLFGDETTFALAEALDATAVFEVSDLEAAAAFVRTRTRTVTIPSNGTAHLDAVAGALADAFVGAGAGATIALAGRAKSIQAVRAGLSARGIAAPRHVKAYWADGRVGLD